MLCLLSANLMSDSRIMSVPRSVIALIFFVCLGQLVDMLRELQFCIAMDMLVRIPVSRLAAAAAGNALGDLANLGHIHL